MARSPEEITQALMVPFPQAAIKQRSDRGKNLDYVEAYTVFHRLIDATGNNFDIAVLDQQMHPYGKTSSGTDRFLLTARVRLTIPGMGSREHMGVQVVMANGGEDMWKGAISDAIKKAATLFGVGLELYGPDFEAGEVDERPAQRPQPTQAPPPPSDTGEGATFKQKSLIRALAQEQRIGGQGLEQMCMRVTGRKLAELDRRAASVLIEALNENGQALQHYENGNPPPSPEPPAPRSAPSNGSGGFRPSDKQKNFARSLWKDLGYIVVGEDGDTHHDAKQLDSYARQFFGAGFEDLDSKTMSALIDDLKAQTRAGAPER